MVVMKENCTATAQVTILNLKFSLLCIATNATCFGETDGRLL
jgi:hypothetical protein